MNTNTSQYEDTDLQSYLEQIKFTQNIKEMYYWEDWVKDQFAHDARRFLAARLDINFFSDLCRELLYIKNDPCKFKDYNLLAALVICSDAKFFVDGGKLPKDKMVIIERVIMRFLHR